MTTKRTRSRRKQSSLRFDMAVMGIRQTNLAIMTRDALMRMQMKIEELEEEINKWKRDEDTQMEKL
jgi:hypothetical protein